jgi:hypothetical protein
MNGNPSRGSARQVIAGIISFGYLAALPAAGCSQKTTPPPAVDDSRQPGRPGDPSPGNAAPAPRPAAQTTSGISTKEKLVLLAGAAALYYLYKKHQNAAATTGQAGQYYLSKNGRVYYRDAEHRAHWVTPPANGIAVPAEEAAAFSQFQGYDNRPTGRDLSGLAADPAN